MRTFFRILAVLAAIAMAPLLAPRQAALVNAQTLTTVTGTITDPNGVPYSGARVAVSIAQSSPGDLTLTPCAQSPCPVPGPNPVTADNSGHFTINLWASASIQCGQTAPTCTSYTFNVSIVGAPPPLGTGPQSFTLSGVAVAGASQDESTALSALAPALGHGGGGPVNLASIVPTGAAQAGTWDFLTNSPTLNVVTQTAGDASNAVANDAFVHNAILGVNPSQNQILITSHCGARPNCYGDVGGANPVYWDVQEAVTATSSGATITTGASDPPFTAGDVGKLGISAPSNLNTLSAPTCFAAIQTYNGPHSVTLASNCSSNISLPLFFWGHDDGPSLAAISTQIAALNACVSISLPGGMAFTSEGFGNFTPPCYVSVGTNRSAVDWYGSATYAGTEIIPLPTFDYTTCGPFTANGYSGCFFSASSVNVANLSIYGLSLTQSFSGSRAAIAIGTTGYNSTLYNVEVLYWDKGVSNFVGLSATGTSTGIDNVEVDGSGEYALYAVGDSTNYRSLTIQGSPCFFGDTPQLYLYGLTSIGCVYSSTSATNDFAHTYFLISIGDTFGSGFSSTSGFHAVSCNNTNQFIGDWIETPASGGIGVVENASCILRMSETQVIASGTGSSYGVYMQPGARLIDGGGNTVTGTTAPFFFNGGGSVFGSASITGTALATGNLAASANFGTGAAFSAPTGSSQTFTFTLTNGTAAVGANPTITLTFPTAFFATPARCSLWQVGGTQPITATTEFLTPTALSATAVTFTYNGTPTISDTEFYQGTCSN